MTFNALKAFQEKAGATFMAVGVTADGQPVEMVDTFGEYEAEYSAIRRHVAILHEPQRGLLRFTGADRKDFLHRMLTNEVNALTGGQSRRAFQLNEKGRIVADVIVHHGDLDTWLELDAHDLPALKKLLESRLFSEDVVIEDITATRAALSIHGPATLPLLRAVCVDDPTSAFEMVGTHHVLTFRAEVELAKPQAGAGAAGDEGSVKVSVARWDPCGVPGMRLFVPEERAEAVYRVLLDAAGFETNVTADSAFAERRRSSLRGRPIGWLAFNTARIEAGSPAFHVDFGPDSLPAETGLVSQAVSFKKGCYLGQEIVARMQNLGHPKKVLVGLRFEDDRLPIAGAAVMEPGAAVGEEKKEEELAKPQAGAGGAGQTVSGDGGSNATASAASGAQPRAAMGAVVGAVTSSAVSPMLGGVAIALAMMKWGKHRPGTRVTVAAEGAIVNAVATELEKVAVR